MENIRKFHVSYSSQDVIKVANDIISIIGDSYLEPICVLLEKLDKFNEQRNNGVQSGYYVNGFSVSICLLAVACLESYIMRVRYVLKATQREIDKDPVSTYLPQNFPDFPYTEELLEIYIVRDVVTHNHLWEFGVNWANGDIDLIGAFNKSSGDLKYRAQVDLEKRQTKKLSLNINPIKIGKSDAVTVLQTMWRILAYLQDQDLQFCSVTEHYCKFGGKLVRFGEILELIKSKD